MGHSYLKILTIIIAIIFTSCSKDELMLTKQEGQERISPSSQVVTLLKGVVTSDSSYDNIVDGSSQLTIILPISVVANNVSISLAKPADFQKIHDVHNQSTQDQDFVTIDFPIRVILPNHKTRSVGSQSALNNLVERLNTDEQMPLSIKCIDIVYPTTFSVFNQESGISESIVLENDEELYVFLDNLDVRDLVGINFPIFYELVDGTQYEATNYEDLELVLKSFRETCLTGVSDEGENEQEDEEESENEDEDNEGENGNDQDDNESDDEDNDNNEDDDEDDDEDDEEEEEEEEGDDDGEDDEDDEEEDDEDDDEEDDDNDDDDDDDDDEDDEDDEDDD